MTPALIQQIKAARRVSVPLVAVTTPDPAATVKAIADAAGPEAVVLRWDVVEGLRIVPHQGPTDDPAVRDAREAARALVVGEVDPTVANPVLLLQLARKLPRGAVLFVHLANRLVADPMTIQAVWNLRDEFKRDQRMLVLLGVSCDWPAELAGDVVTLDEPLPDAETLEWILRKVHGDAGVKPEAAVLARGVEAVQGLPAFQAEQVVAMSLKKSGLDIDALWERKRRQIELTPGLKVQREQGGESCRFVDIGGVAVVKGFLGRVMAGQARPNAVVFIDEIEKFLAGATGGGADSSGVSQDQLGQLLSYMQDHGAAGCIFVGPPGAAKSAVAKAAGNEAGIPTIQLDLGAMKGSLVGASEQNLRAALKVITSVSNGRSLWIATCNAIGDLPPELRRRFTLGTFFFDLPDAEERIAIWGIWAGRYGLSLHGEKRGRNRSEWVIPDDAGWTGAEIKQCCFTPDHALLGSDLRWRAAGEFQVGETVLGFDERGPFRTYRAGTIDLISYATEPVVHVLLESGHSFHVTSDHRFLGRGAPNRRRGQADWKRADALTTDDYLPRMLRVWQEDLSKDAGWLAGILDGEGAFSRQKSITVGQNPGPILDRIESMLKRLSVGYTRRATNAARVNRTCQTIRLNGPLANVLELLGRIRPERLLSRVRFADLGRMEARLGWDRVVSVRPAGKREIIRITTSTGTFLVDGYPQHNCDIAWRLGCTLKEAAGFVVPVSRSAAEQLERLRRAAEGRFLSASKPGVYRRDAGGGASGANGDELATAGGKRRMELED